MLIDGFGLESDSNIVELFVDIQIVVTHGVMSDLHLAFLQT